MHEIDQYLEINSVPTTSAGRYENCVPYYAYFEGRVHITCANSIEEAVAELRELGKLPLEDNNFLLLLPEEHSKTDRYAGELSLISSFERLRPDLARR